MCEYLGRHPYSVFAKKEEREERQNVGNFNCHKVFML